MISNKQKAVIHVAKSQLGLDEESYRDILLAHAGVRSSKGLDWRGFKKVMKHFEACGFESKSFKKDERRTSNIQHRTLNEKGKKTINNQQSTINNRRGMATHKQIKKIYALWATLEGSWYQKGKYYPALRGFLSKRFRVDHENFLDFKKAHSVIEALKAVGSRIVD